MPRRRPMALVLALLAGLVLAACGEQEPGTEPTGEDQTLPDSDDTGDDDAGNDDAGNDDADATGDDGDAGQDDDADDGEDRDDADDGDDGEREGDGGDPDDGGEGADEDSPLGVATEQALRAAAERTGAEAADIEVVTAEEVTWSDGALGCPRPGHTYTQALVEGYRIVVEVDGETLHYHGAEGDDPRYCADPQEPRG